MYDTTSAVLNFIDHLIPFVLTVAIIGIVVVVKVGYPYIKHIDLVSRAHTDDGAANLAKHLARKTGGSRIDVDQMWQKFMPVARELNHLHRQRQQTLNLKM